MSIDTKKTEDQKGAWVNYIGLTILVVCYFGAILNVLQIKKEENSNDVIRLAHWQLELGVRDGINEMIARYEAMKTKEGKNIKIIQLPITERVYTQWVTTQLIGGTAPDMIEVGFFPMEYLGRYFYPLSKMIQEKNIYIQKRYDNWLKNKDSLDDRIKKIELKFKKTIEQIIKEQNKLKYNDRDKEFISVGDDYLFRKNNYEKQYKKLKDKKWIDTFTDGLRNSYISELMDYYKVGFSQFAVRIFYNKKVFKEVFGNTSPPVSFQNFIDKAKKIKDYADDNNLDLRPIASSNYQMQLYKGRYISSVTSNVMRREDMDLDGCNGDADEIVFSLINGNWSPYDPEYKAAINMILDISKYFPSGFMALGRMDSGFSFVQGKAAMITSGSWDANSFVKQINDLPKDKRFDVGIFDFPMVTKDNPKYGKYFDGRLSEANTGTGFTFGITRYSKYPKICKEFMQFCTTPENNTILNKIAAWIPAIRGAVTLESLKSFTPNYVGMWGQMDFHTGAVAKTEIDKLYWPLVERNITYDEYAKKIMKNLPKAVATDYIRLFNRFREELPNRKASASTYLAQSVFGEKEDLLANQLKLLQAWDAVIGSFTEPKIMNAKMKITRKLVKKRGDKYGFAKDFFEAYNKQKGE